MKSDILGMIIAKNPEAKSPIPKIINSWSAITRSTSCYSINKSFNMETYKIHNMKRTLKIITIVIPLYLIGLFYTNLGELQSIPPDPIYLTSFSFFSGLPLGFLVWQWSKHIKQKKKEQGTK